MTPEKPPEKSIPCDPIAERAALSLLSAGAQAAANAAPWSQDLFFDPCHRQLFEVIANQLEENKPVDYLALCQLENIGAMRLMGNSGVLTDILLTYPPECWKDRSGPSLAKYYFDILQDCLQRRGYVEAVTTDLPAVTSRVMTTGDSIEHITAASAGIPHHEIQTTKEIARELLDELEGKSVPECFGFGLAGLDYHLDGGIRRGESCVVCGKPGSGKSILLSMAAKQAGMDQKKIVLFITLEMTPREIMGRIATNVLGKRMKTGRERVSDQEARQILEAISAVENSHIAFLRETDTIAEIERQVGLTMPDLLVVDYIQQVKGEGDTRAEVVGEVSRRLKLMAIKSNIAVLTAAQINDQGELRESRAIGMDADIVLFIELSKIGPIIAVRKNRRGPKDVSVPVKLLGALARFEHADD
jgi:replicative DNA helicase